MDVKKVARLARIKITEDESSALEAKLGNIIKFVEQLSEVDTDNVEPLASVVDIELPLREDVVTDGNMPKEILANAPEENQGYFAVSKMVE